MIVRKKKEELSYNDRKRRKLLMKKKKKQLNHYDKSRKGIFKMIERERNVIMTEGLFCRLILKTKTNNNYNLITMGVSLE